MIEKKKSKTRKKRRLWRWLLAVAVVTTLVVGVQYLLRPDDEDLIVDKQESFKPFESIVIEGDQFEDFLKKRTALLISGKKVKTARKKGERLSLTFADQEPPYSLSSATAVDERGYFLTASHCVSNEPVTVIVVEGEEVRFAEARIIWKSRTTDIALICADVKPSAVFSLSTKRLKKGSPVVIMGATKGPAAGTFKRQYDVTEHANGREVTIQLIRHNALVLPGDSGGPVATTDGQLLGITGRGNYIWVCCLMIKNGVAYHLDKKQLDQFYEADSRK